ncbi:MAG: hypothetical protein LBI14_03830 [Treponema sp.]|jgi:hypothetical protein|nr:hypothetical protein [Treponema sp.]
MDHCKLKDEIISFVRNSPEEVNSKVAVFIAGMQAQKSLTDCRRETGNGGRGFEIKETGLV